MVKLGFIGCGGIARYHAGVINREVEQITVSAAADIDRGAREQFSELCPAESLYEDYGAMLSRAEIDAVCVALPTQLHREAALASAHAGKHVFCEKPMARTLPDCDAILEACAEAGVTLMVGHVRRYDEDWGTWHRLVSSGAIGRPVLWRQTMGGSGPGKWYMDDEAGGGPFLDGCVHNWDFANMVFGEPEAAVGSIMRLGGRTALDSGTAVVRYASGDEVSLCWSWGLPQGARSGTNTDILGPKGIIRFPGSFPKAELPDGFDESSHGAYLLDTGEEKHIVEFPLQNMFAAQWRDFAEAVERGAEPKATGAVGRRAVEVALAVLEAGKTRTSIPIGAGR